MTNFGSSNEAITMSDAELASHKPTDKFVYKVLEYADEPLTQAEIEDETLLPNSTVRAALYRLEDAGFVERDYGLRDTRGRCYSIKK